MSRDAHPYEQYPTEHPGWDRKHFDYGGHRWSLLVIDRPDEQRSSIGMVNGRTNAEPWPHWSTMAVGGLLSVDGAVAIIERVFFSFEKGKKLGADEARRSIRSALGIGA